MNTQKNAWERLYNTRGRLYGGSPPPLPVLSPGSQVLEIGCGEGKGLSPMLGQTWRVTALDAAPGAIRLCRDLNARNSAEGFIIGDASRLPFRSSSFDAIFCIHILGHLDSRGRIEAAAESFRVLGPGGILIFRDFSVRDMRSGTGEHTEPGTRLRGNGIITHYFTEDEPGSLFFPLVTEQCRLEEWVVRINGRQCLRSLITAVFRKRSDAAPEKKTE